MYNQKKEGSAQQILNKTGRHVASAGRRAAYDMEAITLLRDPQYLSRIMKACMTEFRVMTLEEIARMIEDPQIASVPMEPGLTNVELMGLPTESKIVGESRITYDIRFAAKVPGDITKRERLQVDLSCL